jgi:ABC-2 type transport system permease protein
MPYSGRGFAENQSMTSIVNTIRALLTQGPVGDIWLALARLVGLLAIGYAVAKIS